jgi:peptidoglycan/xylan/chitin deacetylase (PgdA/CDA1 family)
MAELRIVFLMYHELEQSGRPKAQADPGYVRYVLSASDFRAQMRLLRHHGWRGMSVGDAITFPESPGVAITFDDGCESDLLVAAPILQENGFGATFYVSPGRLGRPGYMSNSQLCELASLGFEIGCHSMTHAYLTDLDDAGLRREIQEARLELEQLLGRAVEHFSCPGGGYDRRAVEVARSAGYLTLATSRSQANPKSTDPFALGRVPVMRDTKPETFWAICRGHGLWRLRARSTLQGAVRHALGNAVYDRVRDVLLRSR